MPCRPSPTHMLIRIALCSVVTVIVVDSIGWGVSNRIWNYGTYAVTKLSSRPNRNTRRVVVALDACSRLFEVVQGQKTTRKIDTGCIKTY